MFLDVSINIGIQYMDMNQDTEPARLQISSSMGKDDDVQPLWRHQNKPTYRKRHVPGINIFSYHLYLLPTPPTRATMQCIRREKVIYSLSRDSF